MPGGTLGCHNGEGGATGTQWLKARDAAKPPAMHTTGPFPKSYPALDANGTKFEKPARG